MVFTEKNKSKKILSKVNTYISHKLEVDDGYWETIAGLVNVDSIIDVGVFKGTPILYKHFKDQRYYLIDPIKQKLEWEPRDYDFFELGLSDLEGELTINEYQNGGMSSFKEELKFGRGYEGPIKNKFKVPVMTLDKFIENYVECDNIGLKIDVQGSGIDLLNGLDKMKSKITFIIIENDITDRYRDGVNFSKNTVV